MWPERLHVRLRALHGPRNVGVGLMAEGADFEDVPDFFLRRDVVCENQPDARVYDVGAVNNGVFAGGRIPTGLEHGHWTPRRQGGIDYETGRYSRTASSGGHVGVCHGRLTAKEAP